MSVGGSAVSMDGSQMNLGRPVTRQDEPGRPSQELGFGHYFGHRFGHRIGHRTPSLPPSPSVLLFDFVRPRLQKRLMEHQVVEGQKIGAAIMRVEIGLRRRPAIAPRATFPHLMPPHSHHHRRLTCSTTLPPLVPLSHL